MLLGNGVTGSRRGSWRTSSEDSTRRVPWEWTRSVEWLFLQPFFHSYFHLAQGTRTLHFVRTNSSTNYGFNLLDQIFKHTLGFRISLVCHPQDSRL